MAALKRTSLGIDLPDSYHMEGTPSLAAHLTRYKPSLPEGKTGSLLDPYLETKAQYRQAHEAALSLQRQGQL